MTSPQSMPIVALWQRIGCVIVGFVGAGLVITGFFFPQLSYSYGPQAAALPTSFDLLREHLISVIVSPLITLLAPFLAIWSLRSPRGKWWAITIGAILFYNIASSFISVYSLKTGSPVRLVVELYIGWYLTMAGYFLAGIAAWMAARWSEVHQP